MAEGTQAGGASVHQFPGALAAASSIAASVALHRAANGVRYASFGDTRLNAEDLARLVQTVPATIAPALGNRAFYFAPLVLAQVPAQELGQADALVANTYTAELADEAICHRDVKLNDDPTLTDGVFISARLLRDKFALAFELFINVAHAFSATSGIPDMFCALAWKQAEANTRGETSQDSFEARAEALKESKIGAEDKARQEFFEAAFADSLAIYMLSLAVDFDYSELREREYPLLAPPALAERLKLMSQLFPANDGYEFAIRYRRR